MRDHDTPMLAPIIDGDLVLEQLDDTHREGLRAACAADDAIWEIYPRDFSSAGFDASFAEIRADPRRLPFALILGGRIVGMSGWIGIDPGNRAVEIGNTYIAPDVRGTGLNGRIKRLLLARAFACGIHRVEFRVDIRNARSLAAVAKLGAVREGVLRANMITWTGHVRDTAVFSILSDEWRG